MGEVAFQSARDKVGTCQKSMVGPTGRFCAIFNRLGVGKVLVVGRLWFFWWWRFACPGARAMGEIARKTTEKDGIVGSNDGKRQKKRVKSRKNRGGLR